MKIKSLAFVVASIVTTSSLPTMVLAELNLPSGSDRRPDLSLDPFERAREAVRKLPGTKETEEPKSEVVKKQAPKPKIEPAPVAAPAPKAEPIEVSPPDEKEAGEAFNYEFSILIDAMSITAGGIPAPAKEDFEQNKSDIFGLLNLASELDTGAANLWDDGLFYLNAMITFGAAPASGDLHGTSGNYGGGNTMRVYELWYEHSFPYSHSASLIGWHDFNNEFYVSEFANLFVNGGFGGGQVMSSLANPSTYPLTMLGVRFNTDLTEKSYFQFALYDGATSDKAFENMIEVGLDKNDGVFAITEAGYLNGEPGDTDYLKIGFGAWYLRAENVGFTTDRYTEDAPGILADDPLPHNYGVYMLADVAIGENLGLFFKHGRAKSEYNQYDQFYAAGLNYTGIIPGREEDVLGIAMLQTRQSSAYTNYHNARLQPGDLGLFVAETVYEVTYTTQITDWLLLQPDFQYIQQPNMDANLANTMVIGIQAQAVF